MSGRRLSWFGQVISIELRRLLSYRVDFWLHFVGGALAQMALAYFLWRAVFEARGVESLRGYSLTTLLLYHLLVPLVDRLVRGAESNYVSRDIYDGSLNRYLIYPIPFFVYRYAIYIGGSIVFLGQFGVALIAFVSLIGLPQGVALSAGGIGAGLLAAFAAGLMYFFLATTIELLAFWADNIWSLLVLLRFVVYLLGGGMIPLEFFPEQLHSALLWTPFPYMFHVPIGLWMGKLDIWFMIRGVSLCLVWAACFALLMHFAWRRGLRRYSGVGI